MTITKISALSPDRKSYLVESGIPVSQKRGGVSSYPFASMEIGDSFAISNNERREVERVRVSAFYYAIGRAPMKFSVRMTDPKARTYRCWRIA
jgi:hypothetical protein